MKCVQCSILDCIPGTPKTDFRKQLSGDLAFDLTTYTFIGITLPGWGKSRPPKRPYSTNVYENDVTCCVKLMEVSIFLKAYYKQLLFLFQIDYV